MTTSSNHQTNKVRRTRTAYNYYFKAVLGSVKEKFHAETGRRPTYSELAKLVAASWKKADPTEKAHYKKLAADDKRRYALEFLQSKVQEESRESRPVIETNIGDDRMGSTLPITVSAGPSTTTSQNAGAMALRGRILTGFEGPVAATPTLALPPMAKSNTQDGMAHLMRGPEASYRLAGFNLNCQLPQERAFFWDNQVDLEPIQVQPFVQEPEPLFDYDAVRHLEDVFQLSTI